MFPLSTHSLEPQRKQQHRILTHLYSVCTVHQDAWTLTNRSQPPAYIYLPHAGLHKINKLCNRHSNTQPSTPKVIHQTFTMCRSGGARPREHHRPMVGGHMGANQITYDSSHSTLLTGFTHSGPRSTHPTRFIPDQVRATGFMSNNRVGSCVQPPQPRYGRSARAKMRECGYVPRRQIRSGIVPKAKNSIV
jgi:hypothetical protein